MKDYEDVLLLRIKENNLHKEVSIGGALITVVRQLCPEWDNETIEETWKALIDKGYVKEVSLKVIVSAGALNNIYEYITDKGDNKVLMLKEHEI